MDELFSGVWQDGRWSFQGEDGALRIRNAPATEDVPVVLTSLSSVVDIDVRNYETLIYWNEAVLGSLGARLAVSTDGGETYGPFGSSHYNMESGAMQTTATVQNAATVGIFGIDVRPYTHVRFEVSSYTSGRYEATARLTDAPLNAPDRRDGYGNLKVTIAPNNSSTVGFNPFPSDAANGINGLTIHAHQLAFNGSSWDRMRTAQAMTDAFNGLGLAASAAMAWNGTTWERVRIAKAFVPLSAVAVNPEAGVWTPATGRRVRLMGFDLMGSVAGEYAFRSGPAGTVVYRTVLAEGVPRDVDLGNGIALAAINTALTIEGPEAATVTGTLRGTEE
jgi:hypothetical protein